MTGDASAHAAVIRVAREAYGRLVAVLARQTRDITAAEDALSNAFTAALSSWADHGVPHSPEAWLLTAARRQIIDTLRRAKTADAAQLEVTLRALEREVSPGPSSGWPTADPRLSLLFVCARPKIPARMHAPLMLQAVLAQPADVIARLFQETPSAIAQQLVRTKKDIKAQRLPFEWPDTDELAGRLPPVLDALYGGFTAGKAARDEELMDEVIYLTKTLASAVPAQPSVNALAALCLYARARHGADRSADGRYVPLDDQDASTWDQSLIAEAEQYLGAAAQRKAPPDRYQLEAAIQSAHIDGRCRGEDRRAAITFLYRRLTETAPSLGASVGYASALLASGEAATARAVLAEIETRAARFQPYWAALSAVSLALGDLAGAEAARDRAADLADDPASEDYLRTQLITHQPSA